MRNTIGVVVSTMAAVLGAGVASAYACPNEALRAELSSAALPDCRAYELVTPPDKDGLTVSLSGRASGERVIASSLASFSGSDQTSPFNFYEFIRGPGGWDTAPLNTPAGYINPASTDVLAMSPDLREGVFEYRRATEVDPRNRAYYVRTLPDGLPVEVGPLFSRVALESNPVVFSPGRSIASTSKDLTHVLFMLEGPTLIKGPLVDYVWPGDTTAVSEEQGFSSLYEYSGTGNSTPVLVGVDKSGHLIGECGTSLGYPTKGSFEILRGDELYNAISADGSRVFFTVAAECSDGAGPPANELFARVDGSRTVSISEPSIGAEGDCSECDTSEPTNAVFQGASEDGSKVFFLSQQHLLEGSGGTSLYEYDFDAEKGKRVVLVAPQVAGVSRVSEDGSRVYFVATDVLTSAPNPVGSIAQSGADNLYVSERDASSPGGHIAFIGTLSPADASDWSREDRRPFDATPDGRFVVFTSSAALTPDDTSLLPQVFEYDAQAETLVLISRAPEGSVGAGGGDFEATISYPSYTGSANPAAQPSSVSDDGAYVVFQTNAGFTPQAVVGYPNVYEYHAGRLSLISDSQARSVLQGGVVPTTQLLGVDGSGANIFFTTGDQLVPQDGDTQEDVYDARSGGGFLPPRRGTCEGDGCQGASVSPPLLAPPASGSQAAGDQVVGLPKPVVKAKVKHKTKKAKRRRKAKKATRRSHKTANANRSKRR